MRIVQSDSLHPDSPCEYFTTFALSLSTSFSTKAPIFFGCLRVSYLHDVPLSINISVYIAKKTRIFSYIITVQFSKLRKLTLIQYYDLIPQILFKYHQLSQQCILYQKKILGHAFLVVVFL